MLGRAILGGMGGIRKGVKDHDFAFLLAKHALLDFGPLSLAALLSHLSVKERVHGIEHRFRELLASSEQPTLISLNCSVLKSETMKQRHMLE